MMAGPEPTREHFVRATQTIWFMTGSVAGPIDLTPTDRMGNKSAIFLKFDGEKRTLMPGIYTSDWRFDPSNPNR
jgi:branched-chain amino acid transport system substrate-binding protein